jgi:phenylacetate 2-hydroxylase
VIYVNSYDTVRHFWIANQAALADRPTFHTFHKVVSSTQGFTIGTSPWSESTKRKRKASGTPLNRPSVATYMPIMDMESTASIKELWENTSQGVAEVNPRPYLQRFSLNTSLSFTYGVRIDGSIGDQLLQEIIHVEKEMAAFRGTSNNWADYIPLLRFWNSSNTKAEEYRRRRDKYLGHLLSVTKTNIENGTSQPCIVGNILTDTSTNLTDGRLSLKSTPEPHLSPADYAA